MGVIAEKGGHMRCDNMTAQVVLTCLESLQQVNFRVTVSDY